jgi:hypothetical protein
VLQAERMAMFFVDSIRQEMFCVVSADVEGFSLPLSKGISGAVAMSGKGLNIPDVVCHICCSSLFVVCFLF